MEKIIGIMSGVLGLPANQIDENVGPATHPQWNSLAHITLISALEQEFNIQFEMNEILEIKTAGDLVRILQVKGVS